MPAPTRAIPRRAVISWMLYDLANVIFSMGVISLYFSLFVRAEVGSERADSLLGRISALSMGIMFCLSPLLGAMTDRARKRMPFLVWATLLCCACTALIGRGPFAMSALLFVIANGAYQAGVQFYDSLLPDVTTEEDRGRINGIAIGLGYAGSYIAVGAGLLMSSKAHDFPFAAYFLFVAVAFLAIAFPCFVFVREVGNPNPRPIFTAQAIAETVRQTIQTLKAGERYPGLLRFLIGRAFYTDAINTVILFMSLYTVNVAIATGLTKEDGEQKAQLVLMSAITAAILGGVIWGFVVDRLGPKRTLDIVLSGWIITFVTAAAVGLMHLHIGWLFAVACAAGICLGGTWASDRPLMLRLTPPDRVGEFYGLYGMVGRFSAVTGPLIWGFTTWLAVEQGGMPAVRGEALAILSLLAMMIVAFSILRRVSDAPRDWKVLSVIAAAALLAFAPARAFAQKPANATLTGTITDIDGRPLVGVYVDISGGKRHATTDERGRFRITKLTTDSLVMIVRRVGLVPLTFDLVLVPGDNVATIKMDQVPQILDAVRSSVEQTGLFGVVGDTAYDVVPGATVTTVVHKMSTTTNERGQFFFDPIDVGADMVDVRKLGFLPRLVSFTIPPKGGQRVAIWMTPLPVGLNEAALKRLSRPSNALTQELFDFAQRRRWEPTARALFATREQLAQYAAGMRGSDALRYLPKFGTVRPIDIDCVMVDGVVVIGASLDDFNTNEMETLEIVAVGAFPREDAETCRADAPRPMSGGPPSNGVGGRNRSGGARRMQWAAIIMLRH